jgi:hypothetical protein
MVIDAPPGKHDISFEFPTPLSNIFGRVLTLLTCLVCITLVWLDRRR